MKGSFPGNVKSLGLIKATSPGQVAQLVGPSSRVIYTRKVAGSIANQGTYLGFWFDPS